MKKMETSKFFLFLITIITVIVTAFSIYEMILLQTWEPLCYLIPSVFTELASATGVYYWKSKNENKIKITLNAVKEMAEYQDLNDQQTRILESLINTLS